jgi:hypothetical protein
MSKIRTALMSIAVAGAIAAGAFAPTVSIAQSTSPSMTDKAKSTAEDVSKWTQKQWDAAKAKWVKQKDKWNSCNKQAADKKLSGRDSWSFLYTCMTAEGRLARGFGQGIGPLGILTIRRTLA